MSESIEDLLSESHAVLSSLNSPINLSRKYIYGTTKSAKNSFSTQDQNDDILNLSSDSSLMISSRLWKKDRCKKIDKENKNSSRQENPPVNKYCNEKDSKNLNSSSHEKAVQELSVNLASIDGKNLVPGLNTESVEINGKRPWYSNILSPTYKSRLDDFKKNFRGIPDDERLLADYSCALQKDVLVHGRLYVSQNYVCFHANIFVWETSLTIKWKDVISVTKEKTAHLIPNAILIQNTDKNFFFTSFFSRDKAYWTIRKIWQNALMEKKMSANDTWQIVHEHYGKELGLSSDDETEDVDPHTQHNDQKKQPGESLLESVSEEAAEPDNHLSLLFNDDSCLDQILKMSSDSSHESREANPTSPAISDGKAKNEQTLCTSSHSGRLLIDTVIPVHVDELFTLLFTSSKFFLEFHGSRNTTDLNQSAWVQDAATGQKKRKTSFTISLNRTLGPKTSHVTEIQTMLPCSVPAHFYCIDVDSTNAGIPYAESFGVWTHYCIKRISEKETSLKIYAEIRYKKNVWGIVKTFLEKNCWSGMQEYFDSLVKELINECKRNGAIVDRSKTTTKRLSDSSTRDTNSDQQTNPRDSLNLASPSSAAKKLQGHQSNNARTSHGDSSIIFSWILLIAILCLIVMNGLLYYKLTSFETSNYTITDLHVLKNTPKTEEDWINLLQQQESLHTVEIKKWQRILHTAVQLLKQMEESLTQLQMSVHPTATERIFSVLKPGVKILTPQNDQENNAES